MPLLAFVLLTDARALDTPAFLAAADRRGLRLEAEAGEGQTFRLVGDAGLVVLPMVMPAPHPDAAEMPAGMMSPEPEAFERARAHVIVTALGEGEDVRVNDRLLALLTAAVIDAVGDRAIAAMLGHGRVFHRAEVFRDLADLAVEAPELVPELAIDVTAARESETHMSFLTHNMGRYGREEVFMRCAIAGKGAQGFLMSIVRWLLTDADKQFRTGETIGRTAEEKIRIQRVPNPTGEGPPVLFLDLVSPPGDPPRRRR